MMIVALFTLTGLYLMSKRINQSRKVYRIIKKRMKEPKPLYSTHSSYVSIISFVLLCTASSILVFLNIRDPKMTGLGIVVVFISIGELVNALTICSFYYDDNGFYYYHQYFKRNDIKQMKEVSSFFGLTTTYSIETKSGDLFSISRKAYMILQRKGGKSE